MLVAARGQPAQVGGPRRRRHRLSDSVIGVYVHRSAEHCEAALPNGALRAMATRMRHDHHRAGGSGDARAIAPADSISSIVASLAMSPAFQLAGHLRLTPTSAGSAVRRHQISEFPSASVASETGLLTPPAPRPCADQPKKWLRTRRESSVPRDIQSSSGRCLNTDRRQPVSGLRQVRRQHVRSRR